jgi:hypothetical protein
MPSLEPSASEVDGWVWVDDGADADADVEAEAEAEVDAESEVVAEVSLAEDALEASSEGADPDAREVLDTSIEAEPETEIEAVAEVRSADPDTVEFKGSTA